MSQLPDRSNSQPNNQSNFAGMKLEAILQEKSQMRDEIVMYSKSMHQVLLAFVAVLATTGGVYWGKDLFGNPQARAFVLLFLSQIEIFIVLFVMALASSINYHARYIGALEKRINDLCAQNVNLWETKVSLDCHFRPGHSFFWILATIIVLWIGMFACSIVIAIQEMNNFLFGFFIGLESVGILVLFAAMFIENFSLGEKVDKVFGKHGAETTK